jgi:hypothetical protein
VVVWTVTHVVGHFKHLKTNHSIPLYTPSPEVPTVHTSKQTQSSAKSVTLWSRRAENFCLQQSDLQLHQSVILK